MKPFVVLLSNLQWIPDTAMLTKHLLSNDSQVNGDHSCSVPYRFQEFTSHHLSLSRLTVDVISSLTTSEAHVLHCGTDWLVPITSNPVLYVLVEFLKHKKDYLFLFIFVISETVVITYVLKCSLSWLRYVLCRQASGQFQPTQRPKSARVFLLALLGVFSGQLWHVWAQIRSQF